MDEKNYNSFDPERLENFEFEADYIMDGLRNDNKFCQRFIYGTDPKKCNIARLRSKIINDIKFALWWEKDVRMKKIEAEMADCQKYVDLFNKFLKK